jgi:hypothetical protein
MVLDSILQALRSSGAFALVVAGEPADEASVPRAHVVQQGQDSFPPDDAPGGRWLRLRYRVQVRTRAGSAPEGAARASELAESAVAALLADPHRGGLCADLPVGRATEIGRLEPLAQLRRPEAGAAFDLRCHREES